MKLKNQKIITNIIKKFRSPVGRICPTNLPPIKQPRIKAVNLLLHQRGHSTPPLDNSVSIDNLVGSTITK